MIHPLNFWNLINFSTQNAIKILKSGIFRSVEPNFPIINNIWVWQDLSVRAWNVLEPSVLTTQRFPTNRFNQYFLHIKYNCQCGTEEEVTAIWARGSTLNKEGASFFSCFTYFFFFFTTAFYKSSFESFNVYGKQTIKFWKLTWFSITAGALDLLTSLFLQSWCFCCPGSLTTQQ